MHSSCLSRATRSSWSSHDDNSEGAPSSLEIIARGEPDGACAGPVMAARGKSRGGQRQLPHALRKDRTQDVYERAS
jgi:hypothetical protein